VHPTVGGFTARYSGLRVSKVDNNRDCSECMCARTHYQKWADAGVSHEGIRSSTTIRWICAASRRSQDELPRTVWLVFPRHAAN